VVAARDRRLPLFAIVAISPGPVDAVAWIARRLGANDAALENCELRFEAA
jgi:hypothetical protein